MHTAPGPGTPFYGLRQGPWPCSQGVTFVEVGGLGPREQGSEREAGDCPTNRFLEGTLQKPRVRLSSPDCSAGKQLLRAAEAAGPQPRPDGAELSGKLPERPGTAPPKHRKAGGLKPEMCTLLVLGPKVQD